MHRPTIGRIAIVLGAAGLLLWAAFPEQLNLRYACWRMGLLMGLFWLSLPQLRELPRTVMVGLLAAALIVCWKPRLLWLLLPVALVLWMLRRPRTKP